MERLDLVERRPDPDDRRCNRIHLTPRGKQIRKRVGAEYLGQVHAIIGVLEPEELAALLELLARLRRSLDDTPL